MPIEDTGAGALPLEKTEHPRNSKWRYNIMMKKGEGEGGGERKQKEKEGLFNCQIGDRLA